MPMSAALAMVAAVSVSRMVTSTGPGRVLDGLGHQRQRVLVVAVEDHEGQVRVLARDELHRLAVGHGERRHLVAEDVEHLAEAPQVVLTLVGEEHPEGLFGRGHGRPSSTLVPLRPAPGRRLLAPQPAGATPEIGDWAWSTSTTVRGSARPEHTQATLRSGRPGRARIGACSSAPTRETSPRARRWWSASCRWPASSP